MKEFHHTTPRRLKDAPNLRDLSCLLRCSLLLNARLQYWHLYFFSGAVVDFFVGVGVGVDAEAAAVEAAAAGILKERRFCS